MDNRNIISCLCFAVAISMGYTLYQQQMVIEKQVQNMDFIKEHHEEIYGKKFEDTKRRTPNIDKIVEYTGIKPSKNIESMIKEIVQNNK